MTSLDLYLVLTPCLPLPLIKDKMGIIYGAPKETEKINKYFDETNYYVVAAEGDPFQLFTFCRRY